MRGIQGIKRWLAARGERYAHRSPADWTIDKLLNEAWEKGIQLESGTFVQKGTRYIAKTPSGWYSTGVFVTGLRFNEKHTEMYRVCPPLSSVIPGDCYYVWAQVRRPTHQSARVIFRRIGRDEWMGVYKGQDIEECRTSQLINPVPVPGEES